jgi:hypothetical protein
MRAVRLASRRDEDGGKEDHVPAGKSSITVKPDGRFARALMNLKRVALKPARGG